MYTELVLAIELKKKVPPAVIEILDFMVHSWNKEPPEIKISHPLFKTEHWTIMLACDSYYFPGRSQSIFEYDGISQSYFLTVRSNFKNYGDEIRKFLHWMAPYSQTGINNYPPMEPYNSFVGHFRYEENEHPTLIYFKGGKAYLSEVEPGELKAIELEDLN